MAKWKKLSHTIFQYKYHIIWCPKYRYRMLKGVVAEFVEQIEGEEQYKKMKLSFYDGRKIPYSFEIISYKENEPEKTNIIKYETNLFICQNIP